MTSLGASGATRPAPGRLAIGPAIRRRFSPAQVEERRAARAPGKIEGGPRPTPIRGGEQPRSVGIVMVCRRNPCSSSPPEAVASGCPHAEWSIAAIRSHPSRRAALAWPLAGPQVAATVSAGSHGISHSGSGRGVGGPHGPSFAGQRARETQAANRLGRSRHNHTVRTMQRCGAMQRLRARRERARRAGPPSPAITSLLHASPWLAFLFTFDGLAASHTSGTLLRANRHPPRLQGKSCRGHILSRLHAHGPSALNSTSNYLQRDAAETSVAAITGLELPSTPPSPPQASSSKPPSNDAAERAAAFREHCARRAHGRSARHRRVAVRPVLRERAVVDQRVGHRLR